MEDCWALSPPSPYSPPTLLRVHLETSTWIRVDLDILLPLQTLGINRGLYFSPPLFYYSFLKNARIEK